MTANMWNKTSHTKVQYIRVQQNTSNTKLGINRIKIRELKCETRHHIQNTMQDDKWESAGWN